MHRKEKNHLDFGLLALIIILVLVGTLSIANSSAPLAQNYFSDSFYFIKQQLLWGVIGVIAMLFVSNIHYSFWKKLSVPIFIASLFFLCLVVLPGFGSKLLGARRWIDLGLFSFQPSEISKFALVLFFASLADAKKTIKSYLVALGLVAWLIMLQPDLGTTIIITATSFVQMFILGIPIVHLMGTIFSGGILAILLILFSPYRRERLMTFLQSGSDPHGSSYHINQILIALGSGGLFGVGLGKSKQKYLFLPESATDSVFAIISEEIGFVGSFLIISLFAFFLYRAIQISIHAPDAFSRILSCGIVAWIGVQFFLNISSMIALTPLTGVPLPFFSYGGTNLMMILFSLGILLNISKYARK